jgi:hypothetical protein
MLYSVIFGGPVDLGGSMSGAEAIVGSIMGPKDQRDLPVTHS